MLRPADGGNEHRLYTVKSCDGGSGTEDDERDGP